MAEAITIDPKRLARITKLKEGAHRNSSQGFCIMEAVAYVAREPWSDHPRCASPVIAAFLRRWNDTLPTDEDRARLLLPLIPKLVDTRDSDALENRRATMAADWMVREYTPVWLRLAGLTAKADALANLPEITNFAQTPSLMGPLNAAKKSADAAGAAAWAAAGPAARAAARAAAWDAAWDAAWAAARAAAWDAAGAAAWAAARAAARAAAWDAAWAAARAAAWHAAGAAARAAARAKLEPTVAELQQSAVRLVERMCAAREAA